MALQTFLDFSVKCGTLINIVSTDRCTVLLHGMGHLMVLIPEDDSSNDSEYENYETNNDKDVTGEYDDDGNGASGPSPPALPGEEAFLAHVKVEALQTAISVTQ